MIKWITDSIGTAAYEDVVRQPSGQFGSDQSDIYIVDVRDMVDKTGNIIDVIKDKIGETLSYLKQKKKVVICCDYGMSRSNVIAAGVLSCLEHISFNDAIRKVILSTGEKNINIEVLSIVRKVVEEDIDTNIDITNNSYNHKKHILVTGNSGFIGSVLVPYLKNCKNYDVFTPKSNEIDIIKDIVDLDLFVKEQEITYIIHLANPRIYSTNDAMGKTLVMLRNILDVCKENEIKLIYPSSWEVYSGYRSMSLLASESLPKLPKGPYGESKYLCEVLIEHFQCYYGLECAMIRSSPIYGIGGNRPKFIYNFIRKAINNEDIITHKYINGYPNLDLLYIDDLVRIFIAIIENNYIGSLNVGNGNGVSTTEVAQLVIDMLGSNSSIRHNDIKEFAPNIIMDISRARSELNWYPTVNIQEGLNKILDDFVSRKL